jgi:long-chain acyl-CoA synthetase
MHAMNCFGGCNVLIPKFNRNIIINYIRRGKLNYLVGVPSVFAALLAHPKFRGDALKKINASFVGGDMVSLNLLDSFNELMIKHGSPCRLLEGYGPSETCSATCVNTLSTNRRTTCGKPQPCSKYRIYDEEKKVLKTQGIGELYIGGDSLFNGYFANPNANAECVFADNNGERYLKSGDIVEIDNDGYVTFKSRIKRVIKVSGFAVFPNEIEQVAMSIGGIKKACAIGVPHEKTGHTVVLYYETNTDDEEVKSNVQRECKKHLEPKAVPTKYIYIDKIPLTPLNKTDVIALRKLYDGIKG